ncbi:hypothetical protein K505DRAFT_46090 [Melanomma pulvis-pyrius CBS 109.77]|uniref:Uncharacterized protein n=1 Tax=Melanomma pulvis-pyrius CBS 109.77 TaxID=1314802 RepID=A0A6A6X9X3_9PLEO|nr:hypothetical protein K505DRAFT_46090 [Melanomma pulvis-pyrius CBS 109.77]
MESAAKRKAASAAASEMDSRAPKRQKLPVRASPCECSSIVGGGDATGRWSGVGCDAVRREEGALLDVVRRAALHHARQPLPVAATPSTPRRRCIRAQGADPCRRPGPRLLTPWLACAGRHRCRLRDGRDHHHHGLEVPRESAGSKGQDVSDQAPGRPPGAPPRCAPTDCVQRPPHFDALPHPP